MKILQRGLATIISITAIVILLITAFEIGAYSDYGWYQKAYEKYDVLNDLEMEMKDVMYVTEEMMASPAPYVRLLAFNDRGRKILRQKKETFPVLNAGESADHPYWALERRSGDLYGLFATDAPEPPGAEENRRVVYVR